jgi:hypothetical protein
LHTIIDLYDETSSDQANLERICYSLEITISELEAIRASLRRLDKSDQGIFQNILSEEHSYE